jgi:hypothetical protein
MQDGDSAQAENSTAGERPSLGADVGASDDLPSQRLFPGGDAPEVGERRYGPAATNFGEMDRAIRACAMAGWNSDTPGNRSAVCGNETSRLCRRRRRARDTPGTRHDARQNVQLGGPSDFRQDVARRLAPMGVPAHGPSPSAVRRLRNRGARCRAPEAHSLHVCSVRTIVLVWNKRLRHSLVTQPDGRFEWQKQRRPYPRGITPSHRS